MKAHLGYMRRNIVNKRFECTTCNKSFRDKYTLDNHLKSTIHTGKEEPYVSYKCAPCLFHSDNKSNYTKHLKTTKHISNTSYISAKEEDIDDFLFNPTCSADKSNPLMLISAAS